MELLDPQGSEMRDRWLMLPLTRSKDFGGENDSRREAGKSGLDHAKLNLLTLISVSKKTTLFFF